MLRTISVVVLTLPLQAAGAASTRAFTPAQVETDWLRQEEVRGAPAQAGTPNVKPEEDALGAVDGVKDGKWGFHTLNEEKPWWQVDLGQPTTLGRVVLWNRCDSCGERNQQILVLLSTDAKSWTRAYQHNGTPFFGKTDGKPLVVDLGGKTARYIRLQHPGKSYFHLDEVEVFAPGGQENLALGKPATQSSVSQWSVKHGYPSDPTDPTARSYPTETVLKRGVALAAALRALEVDTTADSVALRQLRADLAALPDDAPAATRRALHLRAHWAVRRLALSNTLLNFDQLLFVKRVPPAFPHMSDQYYGWWSRPGGGVYLLEGLKSDAPRVRCLTEGWAPGSFLRPELSYDGTKVLFAYCKFYPHLHGARKRDKGPLPEDAFYQLFEMNLDGSGVRQLTHGKYDDFDGRYLPDGRLVFVSTRKGLALQCNRASGHATTVADLPDSYVRCGGSDMRPVPVFTLHRMNADGSDLVPLSAFENFEWNPCVSHDGNLLYARWDYIDRHNGPFVSLWSTNPNGANPQLVYGNFTTKPQCVFEARPVPGSQKLMFTAAAHHSNEGGSLVLLDRTRGFEGQTPLKRLTPDACFPETEGWPNHYYANPYPLSEDFFLVSWSDRRLPPHGQVTDDRNPVAPTGLYLADAFGNLELLHRDPDIASMYPLPVRARPRPPVLADTLDAGGEQKGYFLLQDVYRGLRGIARGAVHRLRILGVPPKVQPQMNTPSIGVSKEDPGKFVLGTVPVEADGSAWFPLPSGVPVFFQALDDQGMALQTMRTLTYVQPGHTLTCIGCHEHRDLSPAAGVLPTALTRSPSRLKPGPEGSWPLRYDQLVQPVFDRHCVSCHSPQSADAKAAALDFTAARSYNTCLNYADKDLHNLVFEKPQSEVGNCPARKSKLLALLTAGPPHHGVRLDPDSRDRLATWMDTYAQRQGHFSDEQEQELRALRQKWAVLLRPAQ